jgi:hypothetical protein
MMAMRTQYPWTAIEIAANTSGCSEGTDQTGRTQMPITKPENELKHFVPSIQRPLESTQWFCD